MKCPECGKDVESLSVEKTEHPLAPATSAEFLVPKRVVDSVTYWAECFDAHRWRLSRAEYVEILERARHEAGEAPNEEVG